MKEVQRTLLPPWIDVETETWEGNMPEVMLLINAEGSAFNISIFLKSLQQVAKRPLGVVNGYRLNH